MTLDERIAASVVRMRKSPSSVRYAELVRVCDHFFGEARQSGSSHRVYRMPWAGDPRVKIQDARGMAKAYQVRQVLAAVDRLAKEREEGP